jgi:hypothetical protein
MPRPHAISPMTIDVDVFIRREGQPDLAGTISINVRQPHDAATAHEFGHAIADEICAALARPQGPIASPRTTHTTKPAPHMGKPTIHPPGVPTNYSPAP